MEHKPPVTIRPRNIYTVTDNVSGDLTVQTVEGNEFGRGIPVQAVH